MKNSTINPIISVIGEKEIGNYMADIEYLTPNQVAKMLMVSPVTVRQWAQKDMIKAKVTPGGHRRFLLEDVREFARERGIGILEEARREGPKRVLIVDDNEDLVHFIEELISNSEEEFMIEKAFDGFTAGDKVHSFKPDVILLDLMLPGMDGYEVCKRLKGSRDTQHIEIIAMTGYFSKKSYQQIISAGAKECLAKPFKNQELLKLLGIQV